MPADDRIGVEERRGLERRLEEAEKELRELDKRTAVMMAKLEALISTMDSRDKAFERGQDLILERLNRLQAMKERWVGALTLVGILGISGIVGGVIAIVKAIKGP